MKEHYMMRIEEAKSAEELDYIVRSASFELRNNEDYQDVYNHALEKIATWRRISSENKYKESI